MKKSGTFCILSSDGAYFAKIIATFCVVLVHSYNIFEFAQITDHRLIFFSGFRTVANSGVPVFFFLSGYYLMLKDNWCWKSNLIKKTKSLLIPYFCFIILYTILNCIGYLAIPNLFVNVKGFSALDWFEHIIGYPFLSNPLFYQPLWFLRDLYILNLLTFIIVPLIRKTPEYILLPALVLLWFSNVPSHMKSSFAFFMLGMKCGIKKSVYIINKPICLYMIFMVGFIMPVLISSEFAEAIGILAMVLFILSFSEKNHKKMKVHNFINSYIHYSFPVFLLHLYPMSLIQKVLALNAEVNITEGIILYLILPFVIIFLCVLFVSVWKRVLPKLYSVFVGGR